MESKEIETCRLCGEKTEIEFLKLNVLDDIGGVKLHQCIEYFCRVVLGEKQKTNKSAEAP